MPGRTEVLILSKNRFVPSMTLAPLLGFPKVCFLVLVVSALVACHRSASTSGQIGARLAEIVTETNVVAAVFVERLVTLDQKQKSRLAELLRGLAPSVSQMQTRSVSRDAKGAPMLAPDLTVNVYAKADYRKRGPDAQLLYYRSAGDTRSTFVVNVFRGKGKGYYVITGSAAEGLSNGIERIVREAPRSGELK